MKIFSIAVSLLFVGFTSAQESTTCDDAVSSLVGVTADSFFQGNHLNFGSVEVPCPAVGEGVAYSYTFLPQTKAGATAFANTMMSAFHDGDDSTDGIDIWVESFFRTTDCDASGAVVNFDFPIFSAPAGSSLCSPPLDSDDRLCASLPITYVDYEGTSSTMTFVVHNYGGCVGNLHLEGAIQDEGVVDDADFLSLGTCVSGMQNTCEAGNVGNNDGSSASILRFNQGALFALTVAGFVVGLFV
ncbi:MAG: hypothetical protein SGARI_005218 [Bacillariaceae sp.]